ncbi:NAD-dependent epimerase/dehydratase family protein [Cryptosporangium phraense]|uniref:NAD(P)-dependent oxidoreductase n=1 Tax=Cryptosporangium phraense TaxID=2593070 RepID=A0A545AG13_9ACTN|nr:NAD(P)-dependent oxidoreductase [Cryptosporangium phraense]TQS40273.1 NAD(P)-dependent oxidoreductase [Cryptosporangium phraense]
MILVTGGLGFLGTHTARALLDLGEECLAVGRSAPAGRTGRLVVEPLDCTDLGALLALGGRYPVTGIVHLAGVRPGSVPVVDELRANVTAGLNVVAAAVAWGVPRVTVASTIGVYGGVPGPVWREDSPLPVASAGGIPASKKAVEVLLPVAAAGATEVVHVRIGAAWGPGGRPASPFIAAPALVHAAVRGMDPPVVQADDAVDLIYAPDCGRAIAAVATAERLPHAVYNIGGGAAVTNARFADALRSAVPGAEVALSPGRSERAVPGDPYLDPTRLRADTGFRPAFDLPAAVADYVAWLRAGHPR